MTTRGRLTNGNVARGRASIRAVYSAPNPYGPDVRLVALSVHGGADIRGGYSDLVVFRRCECWLYQSADASSSCNSCGLSLDVRGFVDETLWDSRGQNEFEKPEGWEVTDNCPKCKTGKFETAYLSENCWC
jgi:hypothetical protein